MKANGRNLVLKTSFLYCGLYSRLNFCNFMGRLIKFNTLLIFKYLNIYIKQNEIRKNQTQKENKYINITQN